MIPFMDMVFKQFALSSSAILLHSYFLLYYTLKHCRRYMNNEIPANLYF